MEVNSEQGYGHMINSEQRKKAKPNSSEEGNGLKVNSPQGKRHHII